jgi:hypothetical protein
MAAAAAGGTGRTAACGCGRGGSGCPRYASRARSPASGSAPSRRPRWRRARTTPPRWSSRAPLRCSTSRRRPRPCRARPPLRRATCRPRPRAPPPWATTACAARRQCQSRAAFRGGRRSSTRPRKISRRSSSCHRSTRNTWRGTTLCSGQRRSTTLSPNCGTSRRGRCTSALRRTMRWSCPGSSRIIISGRSRTTPCLRGSVRYYGTCKITRHNLSLSLSLSIDYLLVECLLVKYPQHCLMEGGSTVPTINRVYSYILFLGAWH